MPRRPSSLRSAFPNARPRPWKASQVDGYFALTTVREPVIEAALVPINGDFVQAEQTALLIESWSRADAAGRGFGG